MTRQPGYHDLREEVLEQVWNDIEDLVNVGAYAPGANAEFDLAVQMKPQIDAFLQQNIEECAAIEVTRNRLLAIAEQIESVRRKVGAPAHTQARVQEVAGA